MSHLIKIYAVCKFICFRHWFKELIPTLIWSSESHLGRALSSKEAERNSNSHIKFAFVKMGETRQRTHITDYSLLSVACKHQ